MRVTREVSDRRRRRQWSGRSALELLPDLERKSVAAVRSTDFVSLHFNIISLTPSVDPLRLLL